MFIVAYIIKNWIVKISKKTEENLYRLRKEKLPNETGGVLIGSFDFERKICYVVDDISNISDSIEYPQSFIRGSSGLLNRIEEIEKITVGNLVYVGEWHSHPTNITVKSEQDEQLMKAIVNFNMSEGNPACMIIVGENNHSVYLEKD